MVKTRKIPLRRSVVSNEIIDKRDLLRIVKNKEGQIFLDPIGKANGRGAYICKDAECLKKAIKSKALNRAFKIEVPNEVYENLLEELQKYED